MELIGAAAFKIVAVGIPPRRRILGALLNEVPDIPGLAA
jgi:hypothetical protein